MPASSREAIPPYVSYRIFRNFREWLQEGIPDRIDRSFWGQRLNGSTGGQLMTALRTLGLIGDDGRPTMHLERLAHSQGEEYKQVLATILRENYPLAFQLPLERATQAQLREIFKAYTSKETVLNKCVVFFVQAAQDAGIELSQHILRTIRAPKNQSGKKGGSRHVGRKVLSDVSADQPSSFPSPAGNHTSTLSNLHPSLIGLLSTVPPPEQEWNNDAKERFKQAFDAVLEVLYPVG